MHAVTTTKSSVIQVLAIAATLCAALLAGNTRAATPGITGTGSAGHPVFDLNAAPGHVSQPDGNSVYTWGYGCASAPGGFLPQALSSGANVRCPQMQLPGPTLIVNQGDVVTVTLHNSLPAAAGKVLTVNYACASAGGRRISPGSCLAFGGHTLGGGSSPRGLGMDFGFSRRA
jgi:FtsP/CotA-like multicopper oxidase with cupredoxin domain